MNQFDQKCFIWRTVITTVTEDETREITLGRDVTGSQKSKIQPIRESQQYLTRPVPESSTFQSRKQLLSVFCTWHTGTFSPRTRTLGLGGRQRSEVRVCPVWTAHSPEEMTGETTARSAATARHQLVLRDGRRPVRCCSGQLVSASSQCKQQQRSSAADLRPRLTADLPPQERNGNGFMCFYLWS